MSEVIHLKAKLPVKDKIAVDAPKVDLAKAFIEACIKLDASLFEPYIKEEHYFQDLDKYRFLASMKENFDRVRKFGNSKTRLVQGMCIGCQRGHTTYGFYTGASKKEFAYVMLKDEHGELSDIFQCYMSKDKYAEEFARNIGGREDFYPTDEAKFNKMNQNNPNVELLKKTFDLEDPDHLPF